MFAIFKRELKSYFTTPSGYIFMATYLFLSGLLFALNILFAMSREYSQYLGSLIIIFVLVVPLLTMRILSEEKKNRTDQMLLTAPRSTFSIALGKFLAPLTLFAMTLAVTFIYPLLISGHGNLEAARIIGTYTGFFLLGGSFISIGVLISGISESMTSAALLTFCALVFTWFADMLVSVVPASALSGAVFLFALGVVLIYKIYRRGGKILISSVLLIALAAVVIITYLIKQEMYLSLIARIIRWFSLTSRFTYFPMGLLGFGEIVYYLSFMSLMVYLTGWQLEKRRWVDGRPALALYTTAMPLLVAGGLILLNLVAGSLSLTMDLTEKNIFTLSEETHELLEGTDKPIRIYALYKDGYESEQVKAVLDQYDDFSNVHVETVDPDRNPALLSAYSEGSAPLGSGSLIVAASEYWKVITPEELYNVNYTAQGPQLLGLKAEHQISSAIAYVLSGRQPVIYEVEGHGEILFKNTAMEKELTERNYILKSVNLTAGASIPEETDILFINGPQQDFSSYETELLKEFLSEGGRLFISLGYSEKPFDNLNEVLNDFNINILPGLVMERDASRLLPEFGDNPFFFAPMVADQYLSDYLKSSQTDPFFPGSIAFSPGSIEKLNFQYNEVMITSDKSLVRHIDTDLPGPAAVAVTSMEINRDTGEAEGTRIFAIGSPTALSSLGAMGILPGNIQLLTGAAAWLDNSSVSLSIPSKTLYKLPLNISTATVLLYALLTVIIIPLIIIISGITVNRKRKNL